jgi:hypothetical protein
MEPLQCLLCNPDRPTGSLRAGWTETDIVILHDLNLKANADPPAV